jgi:hypothetical protein
MRSTSNICGILRKVGIIKRLSERHERLRKEQAKNVVLSLYSEAYGPLRSPIELQMRQLQQQFLLERNERLRDLTFERYTRMPLRELNELLDSASKNYRTYGVTAEIMTEQDDEKRAALIRRWRASFEVLQPEDFVPEIVFINQEIWAEFHEWRKDRTSRLTDDTSGN